MSEEDNTTIEPLLSHDIESNDSSTPIQRSRLKPFVILVATTASLGGVIFGFQLTSSGGTFVMNGFMNHFGWSCDGSSDSTCVPLSEKQIATERALISSLFTIGATVGAVLNSYFVEKWGRVSDLKLACITFIIGALICGLSPIMAVMYIGRFIAGLAIGMFALTCPVYIGECSPLDTRGQMMTLWQLGVTVGMLIGQGVNIGLGKLSWGWRLSYTLNIAFALMLLLGLFTYMPESPKWIASRSKDDDDEVQQQQIELKNIVAKLRYEQDVGHALDAVEREVKEDRELGDASWREVFASANKMRYRVLLGVALQAFNQLSGNEAINFYSPTLLESIFGSDGAIFYSFLLGIVNFVAVVVSVLIIDRVGRLPLFFVGGITMLGTQIASSVYQSVADPSDVINKLFFSSLAIFSFSYHGTWGPLSWDICGEIFPLRERGKAVGITTMSNFLFNTIVASSFSYTMQLSVSGSFGFFCVCIFVNLIIAYFFLPETAHKNAAEIEATFENHKPKLCRFVATKTKKLSIDTHRSQSLDITL